MTSPDTTPAPPVDGSSPEAQRPNHSLPRNEHGHIPSEAVLRGQSTVQIQHNGHVYRLQATRQGKLILTK